MKLLALERGVGAWIGLGAGAAIGDARDTTNSLVERDTYGCAKTRRVNPKFKTKYRVTNWPEYEAGLRARGDVQIWFSEAALAHWMAAPTGRRGAQRRYSDTAILAVLSLSLVFHLPLRQAEGFVISLLRLMGLDFDVPDHSTLSRRRKNVPLPKLGPGSGGGHLIVDSTGLKIYGAGEWSSRKAKKRRGWRKLHIGVDGDGYIVARAAA